MKKLNFGKNFNTYDENALVQKEVAIKLAGYIDKKEYKKITELGAGTGIFTKELLKEVKTEKLILNDYFDSREYFKDIEYFKFIPGDMMSISFEKSDLICSSSSFQWIDDIDVLLKKIAENSEELIFSIYIEDNLKEIKNYFGIQLNYLTYEQLKTKLEKHFVVEKSEEEEIIIEFENSIEVLKHMKKTGVTGLGRATIAQIRGFKEKKLSYKVAYFKCRKRVI